MEERFVAPEALAAVVRSAGAATRGDATAAAAALVDLFVLELAGRAAKAAAAESDAVVDEAHLESVLPQLLLDFA